MKKFYVIRKHHLFQEKEKEVTKFYHKMAEFYLFTCHSQVKLSGAALVQPRLQFNEMLKPVFEVLVLHLKHHAHIMTSTGWIKPPQFASSFFIKNIFVD